MEEKIKIYVSAEVNQILQKDMQLFEFFKKDHSLNKNAFLNTLIINYYESYQNNNSQIFEKIKSVLQEKSNCQANEIGEVAFAILKSIREQADNLEKEKYDQTLSLKPTKASRKIIEYIQNFLLEQMTMSQYFRDLFASYCKLPQDKREQIIFKEQVEVIQEAIGSKRKLYLAVKPNFSKKQRDKSKHQHIVSPYIITGAKEELFNYLLAEKDGKLFSFRLSRLEKVIMRNEELHFSEGAEKVFAKMIEYGPQFAFDEQDGQEICVYLTEEGQRSYERMYVHRPKAIRVEGNHYYFDCSQNQIMQYFFRFGSSARVKDPKELAAQMKEKHFIAWKRYERQGK
ncbi:WYL domain-containing protein [Clostridiales bacterium COT073_COT-073]|nr:WYL domain-containing protein [Clostridiales bacterium COT073_COT-073]